MFNQKFSQLISCVREIWCESQRFAIVQRGFSGFTLLLQGLCEAVMRPGFIWGEAKFLEKLRGSFGGLMIVEQGESKIESHIRVVGL